MNRGSLIIHDLSELSLVRLALERFVWRWAVRLALGRGVWRWGHVVACWHAIMFHSHALAHCFAVLMKPLLSPKCTAWHSMKIHQTPLVPISILDWNGYLMPSAEPPLNILKNTRTWARGFASMLSILAMNAIESLLHLPQHENACDEPSWPPALGVTAGQFSKHLECVLGHGIPTN